MLTVIEVIERTITIILNVSQFLKSFTPHPLQIIPNIQKMRNQ